MTILNDISIIDRGLEWLKVNKPEQYEQVFQQMVDGRRRLRRQLESLKENSAIGAFGESQTGKSYQINTLLNRTDRPFAIFSTDHPEGVGFVDKINPIGDDREATGVVTRLSSFSRSPHRYSPDYPVIVKLLTVAQITTVLASGYYNNIRDYTTYSDEELRAISKELAEAYAERPETSGCPMTEDAVMDIKSYLGTYVEAATQGLLRSSYFETVTRIIKRVPVGELAGVFRYLWHGNAAITRLFERLLADLERLHFAPEVYVPLEAVIHGGKNRNTIMSVACLNGLDEPEWDIRTDVYIPAKEGVAADFTKISSFPTCDLCAVSSEIVFRIAPEYLEEKLEYSYREDAASKAGHMPSASRAKLPQTVDKSLLRAIDLLDFPGARSPEQQDEAFCTEGSRDKAGQSVLVKLFLRGKIAYLFNHYSESHMMKVLLFCHHQKQSEVKNLHILLDQWVRRNVGSDVAERRSTLARTGGVSPLLLVATKMNIDMTYRAFDSHNTETAVNNRWDDRFRTVLLDAVLNWDNVDWFKNWTGTGESFKDTYLLRSYQYSACTPQGNQMFSGYDATAGEPEKELELDNDYYRLLRRTFVSNPSVRKLFFDPELAWDVAATVNNDGSLYIIDRMTRAARAATEIRREHMERERNAIMEQLRGILANEYDSADDSEKLLRNIDTASNLRWELDIACTDDNYFFGHLIDALQVTEAECVQAVHSLVHGTAINNELNNFREYELIRRRCRDFEGCQTDDDRWARLLQSYRYWRNREQAEHELARRNIDVKILFQERLRPKTNWNFIADNMMRQWEEKLTSHGLMNTFTSADGFSPLLMKDLVNTLVESAHRSGLADVIAQKIRSEVSVANLAQVRESLVADIMASALNAFVNDFGYSLLSPEQKAQARLTVEENGLPAFDYIERPRSESYSTAELVQLFDDMFENGATLTDSFDRHYNEWLEYMTIAYVVHLRRSNVRPEANRALGELINEIQ